MAYIIKIVLNNKMYICFIWSIGKIFMNSIMHRFFKCQKGYVFVKKMLCAYVSMFLFNHFKKIIQKIISFNN
jgi:hypothetical protein